MKRGGWDEEEEGVEDEEGVMEEECAEEKEEEFDMNV